MATVLQFFFVSFKVYYVFVDRTRGDIVDDNVNNYMLACDIFNWVYDDW